MAKNTGKNKEDEKEKDEDEGVEVEKQPDTPEIPLTRARKPAEILERSTEMGNFTSLK